MSISIGWVLVIILVLYLLGAPWSNQDWGIRPNAWTGLLLVIVCIALLTGRL